MCLLALYQRALCYCAKQQYDDAEDDIESLRFIDPQSRQAKVRHFATKEQEPSSIFRIYHRQLQLSNI